jgi:hypothetical protein
MSVLPLCFGFLGIAVIGFVSHMQYGTMFPWKA